MSVVLTTRDRPAELRRAIRTVQGQTLEDWELIVVDDGSVPAVVLDPGAAADPRVALVRHPEALGVSRARNAGIARATAPWVAFLDDDDFWWPRKLEVQLSASEAAGAGFSFTGRVTVDEGGEIISRRPPAPTAGLTEHLRTWNLVGEPSTVMAHRDALRAAGPFDPELSVVADWDMWFRLSRVAVPWGVPEETTAIIFHPASMQLVAARSIPDEVARMRARHTAVSGGDEPPLSAEAELWIVGKRWRSDRSAVNLAAYLRGLRRHREVVASAARLARRLLGRAPEPVRAEPWVLEQLGPPPA